MKTKFIPLKEMSEVFCDLKLVPKSRVRNYYLLLIDLMNKNELTKNSIIFENLQQCIENLNPKWKRYVTLKYGLITGKTLTYAEIGEIVGRTGENIRQMVEKSFKTLIGAKIKFYVPDRIGYLKHRKEEIDAEIEYYTKILEEYVVIEPTIENFGFSVRARNALSLENIKTYDELMKLTPDQIKCMKNIGNKTADEIWFKLHGEKLPTKSRLINITEY